MSASITSLASFFFLGALLHHAVAIGHIVGGDHGWNLPPTPTFFSEWARNSTFYINDRLSNYSLHSFFLSFLLLVTWMHVLLGSNQIKRQRSSRRCKPKISSRFWRMCPPTICLWFCWFHFATACWPLLFYLRYGKWLQCRNEIWYRRSTKIVNMNAKLLEDDIIIFK